MRKNKTVKLLIIVLLGLSIIPIATHPARATNPSPSGDELFVSALASNTITRIDLATMTTSVVISGLDRPEGGACRADGKLYFALSQAGKIVRFNKDGTGLETVFDRSLPNTPNILPDGLSFSPAGDLFTNSAYGSSGAVWSFAGGTPLVTPIQQTVAFTTFGEGTTFLPDGSLLATDPAGDRILRFVPPFGPSNSGTLWASTGNSIPIGIIPHDGLVYVSILQNQILRYKPDGSFVDVFYSNGLLRGAFTAYLDFDSLGNLYVANEGGPLVRITPTGVASVVANIPLPIGVVVCRSAIASISVSKFFTDSSLNQLPLDSKGNPMVNVTLAGGTVRSTNPGQVLVWVNVTNTGKVSLQSLKLNDTLPGDWVINPVWKPALGAIHVYFANTTSLATNPEITQPSTVTVSTGNPEIVHLAVPSFNATAIGHPLLPGQSILLSVKLSYGLIGTSQSASSYPINYTDTAIAAAWTQPTFTGTESTRSRLAFFTADAKVVS
jgi:sugar lactone lactonase YvrE